MSNISDPFELIEAYLEGTLSPDQAKEVEKKITTDKAFAEEVSLQKDTRSLLELNTQSEYKKMFAVLDKEEGRDTPDVPGSKVIDMKAPGSGFSMMMKIAAAVLVLVAIAAFYFLGNKGNAVSTDELFAAHYEPYPDRVGVKGKTESYKDSLLAVALFHYTNKNYEEAISGFENVLSISRDDPAAGFYLAEAFLANENYRAAVVQYEKLPASSIFEEITQFHLALAYIKAGNSNFAKDILTEIAKSPVNAYRADANSILESLEE